MNRSEQEIKQAIAGYLRAKRCLVIPYQNVGIYSRKRGRYIPYGTQKGISDLLGLTAEGRFFAIEVKGAKGKTTPYQDSFLETVRSYGCIGIVARSVDDVMAAGL